MRAWSWMRALTCGALALPLSLACDEVTDGDGAPEFRCRVDQAAPYPDGVPYVGVHANAANNDLVPCALDESFERSWFALEGLAMAQPNTFSPDGTVTYAATANPEPEGCRLHAVDVASGAVLWCRTYPPDIIGTAVEVDEDGHLYFSAGNALHSLTAAGEDRWSTAIPGGDDPEEPDGALGLHFTEGAGHIATVTNDGLVLLLAREDGRLLASFDIPATFGLVAPEPAGGPDLTSLLPAPVRENFEALFGEPEQGGGDLSAFLGTSSNFSDNTLGIDPRGWLYVIGGGVDLDSGALVQIRVEGSDAAPTLAPGWMMPTVGGSATSPSISPDGAFVSIGDGAGGSPFGGGEVTASIRIADIAACDANTDDDGAAEVCAARFVLPLEAGPINGSPPLLDDGEHLAWESTLGSLYATDTVDLRAWRGESLLWETVLPDGLLWSSVMTVTAGHIVGTATVLTPSDTTLLSFAFPATSQSELVLVDRANGRLTFRAPVPTDSTSTVTVGPDGSLYVTMLGLLGAFCVEDGVPSVGLVRFTPTGS